MSEQTSHTAPSRATSFSELCRDERAFEAWYHVALPRVFGFVHSRAGGDAVLAEEITASAFLDAVRAKESFAGRADPITWICSIARNRLIDHYRRAARDQMRRLHLVVTDLSVSGDRELDRVEAQEVVDSVLAALPPLERTALMLRYVDGFSVRETARLIGRSESATESLLSRARERVRSVIPEATND